MALEDIKQEIAREHNELELEKQLLKETGDIEDVDATYVQEFIRAVVPETDDPHAPSLSLRMVFLGTLWAVGLGLVN
eukprot:jgi/Hompol1/2534/HPOL_006039-RA